MKHPDQLITCLDENFEKLSKRCQEALNVEEEEDAQDIRLNPALYMPCKDDIQEFCGKLMKDDTDTDSLHGQVINCLQMEYAKGKESVRYYYTSLSSLRLHTHHHIIPTLLSLSRLYCI